MFLIKAVVTEVSVVKNKKNDTYYVLAEMAYNKKNKQSVIIGMRSLEFCNLRQTTE